MCLTKPGMQEFSILTKSIISNPPTFAKHIPFSMRTKQPYHVCIGTKNSSPPTPCPWFLRSASERNARAVQLRSLVRNHAPVHRQPRHARTKGLAACLISTGATIPGKIRAPFRAMLCWTLDAGLGRRAECVKERVKESKSQREG